MRKYFGTSLLLFVLFALGTNFAQSEKYNWLAQDSWNFGFGGTYPKFISANVGQDDVNYGGFLSIQRNFSEHVGLRLKATYLHHEGETATDLVTDNIKGDLDLMYYFVPCEPVSPYVFMGVGGNYFTVDNSPRVELNDSHFDYSVNAGFGAEFKLGQNWKLKTELGYSTVATTKYDGLYGTGNGGILGSNYDSYMSFDLGFNYYFGYGEKSKICQLYTGIEVDYDRIEEIVRRHKVEPTTIDYDRIESIAQKYAYKGEGESKPQPTQEQNWVLVGVNFKANSARISPESYPILYNAAQILLTNPDVNVEIQGYTDNTGSENYNKKLSERRAESVRNFLVAKGIAADRITTVGLGEENPIMDNKSEQGRELNRRIEFKVK